MSSLCCQLAQHWVLSNCLRQERNLNFCICPSSAEKPKPKKDLFQIKILQWKNPFLLWSYYGGKITRDSGLPKSAKFTAFLPSLLSQQLVNQKIHLNLTTSRSNNSSRVQKYPPVCLKWILIKTKLFRVISHYGMQNGLFYIGGLII